MLGDERFKNMINCTIGGNIVLVETDREKTFTAADLARRMTKSVE